MSYNIKGENLNRDFNTSLIYKICLSTQLRKATIFFFFLEGKKEFVRSGCYGIALALGKPDVDGRFFNTVKSELLFIKFRQQ